MQKGEDLTDRNMAEEQRQSKVDRNHIDVTDTKVATIIFTALNQQHP